MQYFDVELFLIWNVFIVGVYCMHLNVMQCSAPLTLYTATYYRSVFVYVEMLWCVWYFVNLINKYLYWNCFYSNKTVSLSLTYHFTNLIICFYYRYKKDDWYFINWMKIRFMIVKWIINASHNDWFLMQNFSSKAVNTFDFLISFRFISISLNN